MLLGPLLVALSLAYYAVAVWSAREREAQITRDLHLFVDACRRFWSEYEHWPSQFLNLSGDTQYGTSLHPNREVINALTGVSGAGNPQHRLNPGRILFLELPDYSPRGYSGLDSNGDFLDPWGMPYQIVLDTDLDGKCVVERSAHGAVERVGVVIWSMGPDSRSGTPDDIVSWR